MGSQGSGSSQSYCLTRIGETALAFKTRMRHYYMQLTKDSLGNSPAGDFICQCCQEGERRRERPYFSRVRGKKMSKVSVLIEECPGE